MITTTIQHDVADPGRTLAEAKRLVAIATEAEDQAVRNALRIIGKYLKKPGTCQHRGKALSAETLRQNELVQQIHDEVARMINNDIPF